ncbi:hypothetical protein BKA62DRAFT_227779 [Auriculariales sp. MPI-PUGE-AT-0066]|nr:hypothetical protein BKA62DRAFT_227779 [Auriculariales sp. MPI-PUGE-AT-0066]
MEATLQERTAQVQQAAAQLLELERQLESSAASAHSAQGTAQHNITALRQAVADSQGELETVRGEADAKDVTLLAAKEQICVLQEDNVRHAARLQELEKEREQIVAEFDARVKAASAEAQQTSFSQQETRWKSEVEQLRAAHAQCEVTIAEARKSFEKSLTASQAELSTMKLELEKARTAASESSNSTPQVEKLQAELAKAKEQTSKYEKTLEDCTKKIQTLEKDCSQSSQDSTQLKDNLEAHLKRAEEAVAAKAIAEKAHQAAVAHHSQSEDAIRAKLTEQQDTNAAALKDVQEKDQKIAAAETERKQLAGQLHDAQMQLSYARNHETDLEKKVKSLTSRSNELEIQVKTLTVELDKQSKNVTESPSRSASKSSIVDTTELPPARPLVLQDTISDAFSAIEDRDAACRFWVYALYDHDPQSQIPQNDVYMAYVKDYKSTSKPRLKASEFFQVCKNMYEGVAIKNRPAAQGPNGATQVEYLVSGLARRHIHKLPLGQAHAPAAPETPTLPAEPSPVKQEMLATVTTLDAGAAPVVHKRTKPWDAKANLDFKMWLRFTVLGVSTAECTHFASSSAGACKRYSFAKHKIQILRDKGWALQGTEFVVPADSTHFRHACFDLNTILEVIGVAPKLYDADLATFVNGAENAPALSKWVDNPDDPELLAKFGHLTRPEIDDHKANPAAPLRPAGLEPTDVKKNRKTKRERDTDGNEDGGGVAKRPRPSSSALPTKP